MTSSRARACVLLTTTAAVGLLAAGTASAHVRADAPGATQGAYAVVSFRVPTESATAATTGLTVTLPTGAGIASVSAEQMAGWTSSVVTSANGSPTAVTWKADAGTSIAAGQYGLFSINVGPLPKASTVSFDTTQAYSDGTTVAWDEPPKADGSEPEHPAPEIALAVASGPVGDDDGLPVTTAPAASGSAGTGSAGTGTAAASPAASSTTTAAAASSDTTARWLGAGGLLLGALGLGLGGGAALRARRSGK